MLSRRLLRIKVVKALYAYIQAGGGDTSGAGMKAMRKNLRESIDRAYDLYFQMLWLVVEVRRYAETRIELGRNKHLPTPEERNPNMKFVQNELIRRIEESDAVVGHIKKRKLGWSAYPELIKELYEALTASDYYKRYMEGGNGDLRDDIAVVRAFYSSAELEDSALLEDVLEEQSVLWNDDAGFAIVMVVRTLERIRDNQTDIPVLPEFKSDEDPVFADTLLVRAVDEWEDNMKLVQQFTLNWDIERIALVDNLVISAAITELTAFDDIPVKVTLDEYIEIAKYYSTPGSNSFINGVLDKVVETLTADGRINKQGKGLI
ncbi:MAG: transcription antitermination protein NusB [Alistipes sp.]|jgi:N utilization substance protein B|nr:transcription antitermination protein NusB [Alistipes sp.]